MQTVFAFVTHLSTERTGLRDDRERMRWSFGDKHQLTDFDGFVVKIAMLCERECVRSARKSS